MVSFQFQRSLVFFVAAVALISHRHGVECAAIIENQTSTWVAAGMADSLVNAWDNILSDSFFERVAKEALIFQADESQQRSKRAGGGYAHGKGGTFWFPLFKNGEKRKPRFAIEAAIHLIYENDFAGEIPERVRGGEWSAISVQSFDAFNIVLNQLMTESFCRWVQHREESEDITFHHDKDEGLASLKSTMRFPEVEWRLVLAESKCCDAVLDDLVCPPPMTKFLIIRQCGSVTYLTETGGPTLLFNQTTPDGNGDIPVCVWPSRSSASIFFFSN
jgi:hypothetical protein